MPVESFNHCNLRAHRALLEELWQFYVGIVGLKEGPRPPLARFGYWLYAGGRDVVHLAEASADEDRPTNVAGTIDHMSFRCSDPGQYRTLLGTHGIAFREVDVPLTGELQFFLRDPAGNGVELSFQVSPAPRL